MGTQAAEGAEFNQIQFEKRLTTLKDSQESINNCCQWCLENRAHHKKIVNCWLNVLKRVKVEQRLVLFYLANDVIQYSKRRRYEYVESWGTALQKATTMVRDDRVKHKILRIFKIWEQRQVYNEEFIADLCGLISVSPSAPKNDEPHEFQANHVVKKIRYCSSLESDTDMKLKILKEHNPKIHIETDLCASLKDRAHVDDVEKEIDVYVSHMEDYVNALKLEIKNRINLISVLRQAETQLETDKKDVKVVANAYRTFAVRVKTFQKKLDEHKATLVSPLPSPDIDAPSPSPDSDIDLPDNENIEQESTKDDKYSDYTQNVQFTNPGYYTPVPAPTTESNSNFVANGYTSFIGGSLPFNVQNFDPTSLFTNSQNSSSSVATNSQSTNSDISLNKSLSSTLPSMTQPPPLPMDSLRSSGSSPTYQYRSDHLPLLPPPMPPFSTKSETDYSSNNYSYSTAPSADYASGQDMSYNSSSAYQNTDNDYNSIFNSHSSADFELNDYSTNAAYEAPPGANPYPPSTDEYNPEQELDTWEPDPAWSQPPPVETDTPESPPMFEKEGYGDPIEYHDTVRESGIEDIDQRVIPIIPIDSDDSLGRGPDIDHRNLISLTGSPADSNSNIPSSETWNTQDQDYRNPPVTSSSVMDQDYRVPPFNIEQLKLPPPPPPPPKSLLNPIPTITTITTTPMDKDLPSQPGVQDIVESIDMDLSDDENLLNELQIPETSSNNLRIVVDNEDDCMDVLLDTNEESQSSQDGLSQLALEPPPPFPDLPDDEDANNFLDDLDNDLNSSEFTTNLADDFPDIPDDELQDDIFDNVDNISASFPNLPNLQLNPPPNLPNLQSDLPPNMSNMQPNILPNIPNMPPCGESPNLPPLNLQHMPPCGESPNLPPPNLQHMPPGNVCNVPSMPPPPPMMTMPPLDWTADIPISNQMPGPNFNFRPRGHNRGNGNYRGNFNNVRVNFNHQINPTNNQMNFNNNRGNFHNARGNFNNNRGNRDSRGRGRGRGRGMFRGPRGRGNFRGNFRGGF